MKKIVMRTLYKLARTYWFFTRPITIGVRAIITNNDNNVLLVKHTYQDSWYLPGGKVNKNETLTQSLIREIHEELNCCVNGIELFGAYTNMYDYKNDHVIVYKASLDNVKKIRHSVEIDDAKFFSIDKMPPNVSRGTKKRLMEFYENKIDATDVW